MKDVYKLSDVSDMLGVAKETLRRWEKSGKLVSERHPINDYRLYKSSDLKQFEQVGFMFKKNQRKKMKIQLKNLLQ